MAKPTDPTKEPPPPKGAKSAAVLAWAERTGRISRKRRKVYAEHFKTDPRRTDALMRMLAPGLPPAAARPARAAARPSEISPPAGSQPTLFANGDRPRVTASGVSPSMVDEVPWQARRAVAAAATQADAHRLIEQYSGPAGQTMAEIDSLPGGPLNADVQDYVDQLNEWGSQPATPPPVQM
jgi:hypothetical protein